MENLFRPNRWFVLFCALLVLVWGVLQLVSNMRLADEAKLAGRHIFTWDWPGLGWSSRVEISDTILVHRSDTDAIVRIKGKQLVTSSRSAAHRGPDRENLEALDLEATLTFYRLSNDWVLGRVELP